jgi:hypothetical protein
VGRHPTSEMAAVGAYGLRVASHAIKDKRKPEPASAPVENEMALQRREWAAQRIAWALLALTIVAALLGLFGDGPLSKQIQMSTAGSLEFERFARRQSPLEWKVQPRASGARVSIAIDAALIERYEIHSVQPEPVEAALVGDRWRFEFASPGSRAAPIVFHLEARQAGMYAGDLSIADAPPIRVEQFIYP